jgi:transcriptional regulator with XRE-family HTH domain
MELSEVGTKLKAYLVARYGSQKRACNVLRLKESYLSFIINGKRRPNYQLLNRLEEIGFDVNLFDKDIKLENYLGADTETDYKLIVGEMRRIIQDKNMIIRSLEMVNRNLQNEINKKKNSQKLTEC